MDPYHWRETLRREVSAFPLVNDRLLKCAEKQDSLVNDTLTSAEICELRRMQGNYMTACDWN